MNKVFFHPFDLPRFRWNIRLQQGEKNSPALRQREDGLAVRLIQKAMIDLGIGPMTNSVKKHGTVDGIFGSEGSPASVVAARSARSF